MYCKHCGAKIDDDSIFCGECGESVIKEEKVEIVEDVVEDTAPIATEETIESEQSEQENIQNGFLALFSNKRNLLIIALSMGVTLLIGAVVLFFVFFNNGGEDKQEHLVAEQSRTVSTTIASVTTAKTTVSTTEKTTTTKVSTTVKATTEATTATTEIKLNNAIKIDASDSLGIGIVITDDANGLNLRSEPSADSKKVATMNETSEVIVFDCGESDWYYCKFDDKDGYAKKEFIQVVPLEINHYNRYYGDINFELYSIIASDIDRDGVFEAIAYYNSPEHIYMKKTVIYNKNKENVEYYDDGESGEGELAPFVVKDRNNNMKYLGMFMHGGGQGLYAPYPYTEYETIKKTMVVGYYYDDEADKIYYEQYIDNIEIVSPELDVPEKYATGHWIDGIYSVS